MRLNLKPMIVALAATALLWWRISLGLSVAFSGLFSVLV